MLTTLFQQRPLARRGVTVIETFVALGLLVTVLSVVAPLVIRSDRLIADARAYRVAVDELTNRLDMITWMPPDEAQAAVEGLASVQLGDPLRGATLAGRIDSVERCRRITISIKWPDAHQGRPPVTLVGWSFTEPTTEDPQS